MSKFGLPQGLLDAVGKVLRGDTIEETMSYNAVMKKIKDGDWEAMNDVEKGKLIEIRNTKTKKRIMVRVGEEVELDEASGQKRKGGGPSWVPPVRHDIVHYGKIIGSVTRNFYGLYDAEHHKTGMSQTFDSRKEAEDTIKRHHDENADGNSRKNRLPKKKYLHKEEVELDESHPIVKEYDSLKKNNIGTLRNMIKGQQKIVDTSEYRTKDHAISAYLRHKHGDKRVDQAFGFRKEEVESIVERNLGYADYPSRADDHDRLAKRHGALKKHGAFHGIMQNKHKIHAKKLRALYDRGSISAHAVDRSHNDIEISKKLLGIGIREEVELDEISPKLARNYLTKATIERHKNKNKNNVRGDSMRLATNKIYGMEKVKVPAVHPKKKTNEGVHQSTIAAIASYAYEPKVGDKVITRGGQIPGVVHKIVGDKVHFTHKSGKKYKTHANNLRRHITAEEVSESNLKAGQTVRLDKPGHTYHGKLADVLGPHPTHKDHISVQFRDPSDQKSKGFVKAAIHAKHLKPHVAEDLNLDEAKSIGKHVMITKGQHAGKTGWVREIHHNSSFRAGPKKSYHVDLKDGGQANGLPGHALRLVAKPVTEEGGAGEDGSDALRQKYSNDTPGQTPNIEVAKFSPNTPIVDEKDEKEDTGKTPKTYQDIRRALAGRRDR